jgi:hypothetical protein
VKTKRILWTVVFLGLTLAAIVMEVVAGVFHPAGTIPWTEYIAQYVPWPIQLGVYVALAAWLPFHFWRADVKAKRAYREGIQLGRLQGAADQRRRAAGVTWAEAPKCSHGCVFGSPVHVCNELPSDAR